MDDQSRNPIEGNRQFVVMHKPGSAFPCGTTSARDFVEPRGTVAFLSRRGKAVNTFSEGEIYKINVGIAIANDEPQAGSTEHKGQFFSEGVDVDAAGV